MPYVARDPAGKIIAVSAVATNFAAEQLDASAPEFAAFIAALQPQTELKRTDQALIRVVEDIVDTLIDKNVILFSDLPEAAQQKLIERRSLRRSRESLDLLGDVDAVSIPEIRL